MKNNKGNAVVIVLLIVGLCVAFILGIATVALDWTTGEHGRLTITAVDKNLFGTHTVYVRNSESLSGNENLEVQYCIDSTDTELVERAKNAVGKQNTTVIYPERRIGFFWFDKCHSAPIKDIKLAE